MPTKHVCTLCTCLETVAEYHKWFASDIIIIYFHCFLSFLFKRKYILTISTVSYVIIIQLLRSRYQTCKFLKWSKIIVRKRLLILFCRNKTTLVICLVVLLALGTIHTAPMPRNKTKYRCNNGKCVPRKHGGGPYTEFRPLRFLLEFLNDFRK